MPIDIFKFDPKPSKDTSAFNVPQSDLFAQGSDP